MIQATDQTWTPPPNLKISDWADRYRRLSPESSAEAGAWRTDRAPYQREIMDSFNDPNIERIVFMKSAQVGATEILLMLLDIILTRSMLLCWLCSRPYKWDKHLVKIDLLL